MAVEAPHGPHAARGRSWVQHAAAIAAANAGTIFGLGLGWTSAAATVADGAQGFPVSVDDWSWIGSAFCLGCAAGSLAVFKALHTLGRRMVILALGPFTMVAWALLLWASSVWMLFAGRLLLGAAVGAATVATPIFVSEMSEPRFRGALAGYFEVLLCLGILIVYLFGKLLSVFWLNVGCLAFSVVHVACFVWFPDTPRWLLLHGREADARKALLFYRGPRYDVDAELAQLKAGVKESATTPSGWKSFNTRAARKAMLIGIVLMILQSITGINAITFYASRLFTEAGGMDAYTACVVVAVVEVVAATVSLFLVDRWGRKPLLVLSATAMGLCTGLLGAYFYFQDAVGEDVSSVSWLPLLFVCVYMFAFSLGWGPVVFVIFGELFSDNIKGVAGATGTATGYITSFLVTKFFPILSTNVGSFACYWGFAALCVVAVAFIVLGVPETKGKTLDEVQASL